eukprot:4041992-Prymnesium_polylepis.1
MSRTDGTISDNGEAMDVEAPAVESSTPEPSPNLRWKCGAEVPRLVRENADAVALVESILSGSIVAWPAIEVTEAVAVQIYRLILDQQRRAAQFAQRSWADVYVVLASLARRELVAPAAAAVKKLQNLIGRKASSSQPLGLDGALKYATTGIRRQRNAEIAHMSYEEATDHLLKKWDLP